MKTIKENKFVRGLLILNLLVGSVYLVLFVKARIEAIPKTEAVSTETVAQEAAKYEKAGAMSKAEYYTRRERVNRIGREQKFRQEDVAWVRSVLATKQPATVPAKAEVEAVERTALDLLVSMDKEFEESAKGELHDLGIEVLSAKATATNPIQKSMEQRRRVMAMHLLSNIGDKRAIPILQVYAKQPVSTLQRQAQKALAKLGDIPIDGKTP